MSRLRRFLEIFLAIGVLTLSTPALNWQDNGDEGNDAPQSSDSSSDLPLDQSASLGDFLLETCPAFGSDFERKLLSTTADESAHESKAVTIPYAIHFLPHLFISECGLMPRAPTMA
jgi:hypothetical protein